MSKVTITDKMPQFVTKLHLVYEDALRETARDILIKAKNRAPYDKGGLRANADISKPGYLKQRVSFWSEYARFQEFGGSSKRRVRKYSTPGTGKGFLRTSGDEQSKQLFMTLRKHGARIR